MILSPKVLLVAALAASYATLPSSAVTEDGNSLNKGEGKIQKKHTHNFLLRGGGNGRKLKKKSDKRKMAAKKKTPSSKQAEKGKANAKTKQDKQKEEQVAREFAPPSTSYNELLGQIGSGAVIPKDSLQSNIESRGNGEGGEEVDIGDAEPNCDIDPKLPSKSFVMSVLGGGDQCKGSCECASGCCVKYWSQICIDPLAGGGYWGDRCIA